MHDVRERMCALQAFSNLILHGAQEVLGDDRDNSMWRVRVPLLHVE